MKREWRKESYSDEWTRKERMGCNMAESRDMEIRRKESGICERKVPPAFEGEGCQASN
jgi:hypothetical protein